MGLEPRFAPRAGDPSICVNCGRYSAVHQGVGLLCKRDDSIRPQLVREQPCPQHKVTDCNCSEARKQRLALNADVAPIITAATVEHGMHPTDTTRLRIVELAEKLGQSWEFFDEPKQFLGEPLECSLIDEDFTPLHDGARVKHGFGGTMKGCLAYLRGLEHGRRTK